MYFSIQYESLFPFRVRDQSILKWSLWKIKKKEIEDNDLNHKYKILPSGPIHIDNGMSFYWHLSPTGVPKDHLINTYHLKTSHTPSGHTGVRTSDTDSIPLTYPVTVSTFLNNLVGQVKTITSLLLWLGTSPLHQRVPENHRWPV